MKNKEHRVIVAKAVKAARDIASKVCAKPRSCTNQEIEEALRAMADELEYVVKAKVVGTKHKADRKFNHFACRIKPCLVDAYFKHLKLDPKKYPTMRKGLVSSRVHQLLYTAKIARHPDFVKCLKDEMREELGDVRVGDAISSFKWNAIQKRGRIENIPRDDQATKDLVKNEYLLLKDQLLGLPRETDGVEHGK